VLIRSHRQEALSRAYIHAIAGSCGLSCSFRDFDYGIDMTVHEIKERDSRYFETGVRIDIQAKSCTAPLAADAPIVYDLEVRSYDILRESSETSPRILVLLTLPSDEQDWTAQDDDGLTLRKCAYWMSLWGMPETSNVNTVRLKIPRTNVFSAPALRELINKVRAGVPL
jgi:hypothetical protein